VIAVGVGADGVAFPPTKLGRWGNIYPRSILSLAPIRNSPAMIAVDGKSVKDIEEPKWGGWWNTITHYPAGARFRGVRDYVVGID